ncbi:group I truncated hemoglobin [Haloarcula sp. GH36]|uniref:group I truncated hemoglobin n=1 Tax=Haloarcula montana TaxID=3111776 RepID=UPI002D799C14|nr:group 1 truncated hemoglobin [Haloarcula sp. GH36]
MSETLYDRLGGADGIEAVVEDFYDRVLDDDSLVEYFEDTDMAELREHQREFITMVTGGPTEYDGADMRTAHAHLDLDGADFAAVAGHLDDALAAAGAADGDREAVLSAVADLEDDVLNR